MAIPCRPGLKPQRLWIVFSAPDMTTVSKPKRNPASAEVSDQKKIRRFIFEAGELTTEAGTLTPRSPDEEMWLILPCCSIHTNVQHHVILCSFSASGDFTKA